MCTFVSHFDPVFTFIPAVLITFLLLKSNGDVGDEFMRALEPLAAIIPYVTVVGNHEQK